MLSGEPGKSLEEAGQEREKKLNNCVISGNIWWKWHRWAQSEFGVTSKAVGGGEKDNDGADI